MQLDLSLASELHSHVVLIYDGFSYQSALLVKNN